MLLRHMMHYKCLCIVYFNVLGAISSTWKRNGAVGHSPYPNTRAYGIRASPSRPSSLLNAKFMFKGTSPTNHFVQIARPMNALQLCR